ncbi:virulence-associated E family protein [Gammaproteobacteria bacterium]|nr:virulence-associated E family protein [Gammaproteobacteria bacterium]
MDQESDFKKAVRLLTDNFSIIDLEGQIRYLNKNNIKDVLEGDGDPRTTKVKYYDKKDIRLQQERLLSKNYLALEDKEWPKLPIAWQRSPHTKYYEGVDFHPTKDHPDILNLWRGHIDPKEGNCDIIDDLLWTVLSNQSQEKYDYLLQFLAHAIQKPEEKPEVMLVFYGNQGTGKGSFFNVIEKIWPYTTLFAQNVKEVVGEYTGGLERAFFVTMDEALFNKDAKSANALKTKVSEPRMRISEKYQPNRTISSFHRFIAATNNEHFAQIARGDRRFFVCEVSDVHKQDLVYFGRFSDALNDGVTVPAFVHKLKNIDLSEFQVRSRPKTREHALQIIESLNEFEKYVLDMLHAGQFTGEILPIEWNGSLRLATKAIKDQYLESNPSARRYGGVADRKIISDLKKMFPSAKGDRWRDGNNPAVRGIVLPSLEVARAEFPEYLEVDSGVLDWSSESLISDTFNNNSGSNGTSGTEPH